MFERSHFFPTRNLGKVLDATTIAKKWHNWPYLDLNGLFMMNELVHHPPGQICLQYKTMLKLGGTTLTSGEGRGGERYFSQKWLAAISSKKGGFILASNVNKIPLHTFGCFCKGKTRIKQGYNNCSWPKGGRVGSQEQKHFPPLLHGEYPRPPGCLSLLGLDPLNPKIKIWILICSPYSFPTEVVGRSW